MRLRTLLTEEGVESALALLVDRYAFLAAVGVAGLGWFGYRRSLLPLALCLLGLSASVVAGLARAGFIMTGAPLAVLLPTLGELALVALLSFHVAALGRRLRRTAALRRLAR
jgi:hypothetical protein